MAHDPARAEVTYEEREDAASLGRDLRERLEYVLEDRYRSEFDKPLKMVKVAGSKLNPVQGISESDLTETLCDIQKAIMRAGHYARGAAPVSGDRLRLIEQVAQTVVMMAQVNKGAAFDFARVLSALCSGELINPVGGNYLVAPRNLSPSPSPSRHDSRGYSPRRSPSDHPRRSEHREASADSNEPSPSRTFYPSEPMKSDPEDHARGPEGEPSSREEAGRHKRAGDSATVDREAALQKRARRRE